MSAPECMECGRSRRAGDCNYFPMQVVLGLPPGWYSAEDGEMCGPCLQRLLASAEEARDA